MQNVAPQHSQPANVFFLMRLTRKKEKAVSNPRATIAQTARQNAGIKMQALNCVQFCAISWGWGVGPTAMCLSRGRSANNFL